MFPGAGIRILGSCGNRFRWDEKSKSLAQMLPKKALKHWSPLRKSCPLDRRCSCERDSSTAVVLRCREAQPSLRMTGMPLNFYKKPALVVYVTCGDPDLATTRDVVLAAIDAGADVIELGVPFSDPVADGPVIQRASERALAHGTRLVDVLSLAQELRDARPKVGLVIFSYLNPVLRFGLHKFADAAAEAGADGVLLTDMIVEEASEYIAEMERVQLSPIFLAAPTSPDERLKAIAEHSKGFVYAISRTGVTGKRHELAADAAALVERIRRWTRLPVAVGLDRKS